MINLPGNATLRTAIQSLREVLLSNGCFDPKIVGPA
jgi:hypothetical protein